MLLSRCSNKVSAQNATEISEMIEGMKAIGRNCYGPLGVSAKTLYVAGDWLWMSKEKVSVMTTDHSQELI